MPAKNGRKLFIWSDELNINNLFIYAVIFQNWEQIIFFFLLFIVAIFIATA